MGWGEIWKAIQGLIAGLSDVKKWKMSLDGVKNEAITGVKIGAGGIKFDFKVGGAPMSLEAVPGNVKHAVVKVNGQVDDDARLVFSLRHQPLKPLIVVLEFKNVTVEGLTKRYRFDNALVKETAESSRWALDVEVSHVGGGVIVGAGAAPDKTHVYDVWFGTNRAPVEMTNLRQGFKNERDPNGNVYYGKCSVSIPKTHRFGTLSTPFWRRWGRMIRLDFSDDRLRLRQITSIRSEHSFLSSLRTVLQPLEEMDRVVMVYLHGYNTSFEGAALRAAQMGFDLKVAGATAFYSWPSKADVAGYFADKEAVQASEKQIADFLVAVSKRAGAKKVHVIAHSMAGLGFARAVSRITQYATDTNSLQFGQIILAAPDIDVDIFRDIARVYPKISERTTMYVSAKDKALALSAWLQDSDRAGYTPPITVLEGIDTVEVSEIDLTMLGHSYFAEAEAVLYDMFELMDSSKTPDKRARIRQVQMGHLSYWAICA